jgi:bifunctional non-homologous end joining protein LigD
VRVKDAIRAHTAIIDSEGVCIRVGRSIFDDFQYRGRISDKRRIAQAITTHPVTFIAFDVLYDGQLRIDLPLFERKKILADILAPSDVLVPTMGVIGSGKALKQETERLNWEGIVAKRLDSKYILDRCGHPWLSFRSTIWPNHWTQFPNDKK